ALPGRWNDRDFFAPREPAHPDEDLRAVEHRHHTGEQDGAWLDLLGREPQPGSPVGRRHRLVSGVAEDLHQGLADGTVVLHDEDATAGFLGAHRPPRCRRNRTTPPAATIQAGLMS